MRILAADGLEEGHGRQIAGVKSAKKVLDVILMIRHISQADATHGTRTQMVGIGRRSIVLERLVMRYVVVFVHAGYWGGSIAGTTSRTVRIDDAQVESTLEPAPGNTSAIEQVTDVWS